MSIIRYLKRIQVMDNLIRRKATGNQESFARKVSLSRSVLNEYLREMRELGFPICYCRQRQTYYYQEEGQMVEKLFDSKLKNEDLLRIKGGFVSTLILISEFNENRISV